MKTIEQYLTSCYCIVEILCVIIGKIGLDDCSLLHDLLVTYFSRLDLVV